jgi:flagellar biosynthesis protein FliQ
MNPVFDLIQKSGEGLLMSAAPLLAVLLIVSIVIGLLQGVFQLQDSAIGFVPKLIALVAACMVGGGFILEQWGALMREALLLLAGGVS